MTENDLLSQVQVLANQGNKSEARKLLQEILKANPESVAGWIMYGDITTNPEFAQKCYHRALTIDPSNAIANTRVSKYQQSTKKQKPTNSRVVTGIILGSIAICLIIGVVFAGLTLFPNVISFSQASTKTPFPTSRPPTSTTRPEPVATRTPQPSPTRYQTSTPKIVSANTQEPTSRYSTHSSNYLPVLSMLPNGFSIGTPITNINSYAGQSDFIDSSIIVFTDDYSINNHTDAVILVRYHVFRFQNQTDAINFYYSNSTISKLDDYWNWVTDRNDRPEVIAYEDIKASDGGATIYLARLSVSGAPILSLFDIYHLGNLVYVINIVAPETSSNSVKNILTQGQDLMNIADYATILNQ